MRVIKRGLTVILVGALLSGCGVLQLDSSKVKEQDVLKYNELVAGTVASYAQGKLKSEEEKEQVLKYLTTDEGWSFVETAPIQPEPLTEEQKQAFQLNGIIYDEYFTALGADGVREVIILSGQGAKMFVTILWGKDALHSISREVVTNE